MINRAVITTTHYLNGFQYTQNGSASAVELQLSPHAEGYVNNTVIEGQDFFNYVYNYTDHLGNIRMSYAWNDQSQNVAILEEHHYYPFGLKHGSYNETKKEFALDPDPVLNGKFRLVQVPNSGYQYQYNGKEWQDELGLNMTAMDFRQYDNALGRFVGIDMLSELFNFQSPYGFSNNNPVYWCDPTGLVGERFEDYYDDGNGNVVYDPNVHGPDDVPNGATYIGPTYTDPSTGTYWDENGRPTYQLDEVVVTQYLNSSNKSNWWIIDGLPSNNRNYDKLINFYLGSYGTFTTATEIWLNYERFKLQKKSTKTALKKISKYINPSIKNVNKLTNKLGILGAAYNGGSLAYNIVSGQEITKGQVFDTALSITLSLIAISNPVGLTVLGIYTLIDMQGGFDGIKDNIGMNDVIINKQ